MKQIESELNPNAKRLFYDVDDASWDWDKKCFDLGEKGNKNGLIKHFQTANFLYMNEYQIAGFFTHWFADDIDAQEKQRLLDGVLDIKFLKLKKFEKDYIEFEFNRKTYTAKRLASVINDGEMYKRLNSLNRRQGNCHWLSLRLSPMIGNDNEVVTGYIYGMSDKAKYLHTWIECKTGAGREVVLDATMNLYMDKDFYYKLKTAEPISRIKKEELIQDVNIFGGKTFEEFGIDIKTYLFFRHEIMKDFEKNKLLFETETE